MKRTIEFYNIVWDTDGESASSLNLPTTVTMEITNPNFDPEMDSADNLSDEYGFCVHSFQYRWLTA